MSHERNDRQRPVGRPRGTTERILSGSDKIILDAGQNSTPGIVPVLPLNDLMRLQLQHPPAQGPKAATSGASQ
jgi:hypothetical protein